MAKRRLNKKVALIGSAVLVVFGLVAMLAFLRLTRDPDKFIEDGNTAFVEKDYEAAQRNYLKARAYAKTDSLRIEMLFKLADVYMATDQWNNVLGCWNGIIQVDPKNVHARFGRLKYVYIMADSGARRVWQEVASQASEFIEVAEDLKLLEDDMAKWDALVGDLGKTKMPIAKKMGSYLYLLRGMAVLEMVNQGAVIDKDKSLDQAIGDLERAKEIEPDNINIYWYLANTITTRGDIFASRGDFRQKTESVDRAIELLEKAAEIMPDEVQAHINLLNMKLLLAQRSDAEQRKDNILAIEPEYLSLVKRFASSAKAYSTLSSFYQQLGLENLDKAAAAIERARQLDASNVQYAIYAANLFYRKFSIYGNSADKQKAEEIAIDALTLPDAQDQGGPQQWASKMNRISLHAFLANYYIEQIIDFSADSEMAVESQKKELLKNAENEVREIEQLFGSGEEPQVIKWRGMLELAKGNREVAIRMLYAIYEQFRASGRKDSQLSYMLAKVFKDTPELGAVREFMEDAISANIAWTKPEAILDYADILFSLRYYESSLGSVNFFEKEYWTNQRSQIIRSKCYIALRQFDRAEEQLSQLSSEDVDVIKAELALFETKIGQIKKAVEQKQMKGDFVASPDISKELNDEVLVDSELESYKDSLVGLVEQLLLKEPNSVKIFSIVNVLNGYISVGEISRASDLVDKFLAQFPNNTTGLFYKKMLAEADPQNVSVERRKEIEKDVLSDIADPIKRAVNLGSFYKNNNDPNEAIVQFKKVVIPLLSADKNGANGSITDLQHFAVNHLFDITLAKKDWKLAEQISKLANSRNLDYCHGKFFEARLFASREQYKESLAKLDECLEQKPVFSQALLLRSNINAVLGNEHASIEDMQRAVSLNPLDGAIAKGLAFALYRRNEKLGSNVSSDQNIETRDALIKAMYLNPNEWQLQSFYSEYIRKDSPDKALAIRQSLQKIVPSIQNAVMLGELATEMALDESSGQRKDALLALAASSFKQAFEYDPNNKAMLYSYARYYRAIGQGKKAEKLLMGSNEEDLLWSHYVKSGQFEKAREVLNQLYQNEPNNVGVIKGLILVAEKMADREAVEKYTDILLSLKDTADSHLLQIQFFLKVGLISEAENKLQIAKELYPNENRVLLFEAWLMMRSGKLKEALELTNRILETDQENSIALQLKGQMYLLNGNYEQAILNLKKAKTLSSDPTVQIALSRAYLRAGRGEDAVTELENLVSISPAPVEARNLLEKVYLQLNKKQELKSFYDRTLEESPDDIAWYNKAAGFATSMGDFKRAEQLYGNAWERGRGGRKDKADEAFNGYLRSLILQGKLDKVFNEARKYIDSDFASVAFMVMAEAKLKLDDRASAIQYCQKAVDKAGENETFKSLVLQRMYALVGVEETLAYCREKLEAAPNSLSANFTMFNLMKVRGEYNKALDYIEKCIEIVGHDDPRRFDYVVGKIAVLNSVYNKTSDNSYLRRSISEYESLLAEMPNNAVILNNLAYMLTEDNTQLAKALGYSQRAYSAQPNNPGFLDTYSYVLYKNGQFEEAARFVHASLQQYEQNDFSAPAEVYEHLGMINEKLGLTAEAIAAYEQAIKTGADNLSDVVKERIKSAIERLLD